MRFLVPAIAVVLAGGAIISVQRSDAQSNPMPLKGKVVLVTGSTDGLGREVALRSAALGANVIVHGRNQERGKAVVVDVHVAPGYNPAMAAGIIPLCTASDGGGSTPIPAGFGGLVGFNAAASHRITMFVPRGADAAGPETIRAAGRSEFCRARASTRSARSAGACLRASAS